MEKSTRNEGPHSRVHRAQHRARQGYSGSPSRAKRPLHQCVAARQIRSGQLWTLGHGQPGMVILVLWTSKMPYGSSESTVGFNLMRETGGQAPHCTNNFVNPSETIYLTTICCIRSANCDLPLSYCLSGLSLFNLSCDLSYSQLPSPSLTKYRADRPPRCHHGRHFTSTV